MKVKAQDLLLSGSIWRHFFSSLLVLLLVALSKLAFRPAGSCGVSPKNSLNLSGESALMLFRFVSVKSPKFVSLFFLSFLFSDPDQQKQQQKDFYTLVTQLEQLHLRKNLTIQVSCVFLPDVIILF